MAKYFCKAKQFEDEESVSFQCLFVSSNLNATQLAYKLSEQAKKCKRSAFDAIGEVEPTEPYDGFILTTHHDAETELIEEDNYFKKEAYFSSIMFEHTITWQVEIIRIDDIDFLEV